MGLTIVCPVLFLVSSLCQLYMLEAHSRLVVISELELF